MMGNAWGNVLPEMSLSRRAAVYFESNFKHGSNGNDWSDYMETFQYLTTLVLNDTILYLSYGC